MKIKKLGIIVLIGYCAAAAGCISFPKSYSTDQRPISPKLGGSVTDFYQVIDTLQPDLRWKDTKSQGQTYDVAVWQSQSKTPDKSIVGTPFEPREWGKQVYYVQGISANYFRIDKPLQPNTCYHWSVRIRTGGDVSEWATFSQAALSPIGLGYAYRLPYGFITPRN
ncbi:MAG: hypothetical protein P4L43_19400 [Syntrophobacteraceae bacterium]|nr:hypothetical protein [Syntrophobacteraceae bacterium]